jgi:polysaccharide transporter, PST family
MATLAINTVMMYRHVPFQRPSIRGAIKSLRDGWNLFVYEASTSIYSMSNAIILGFLAPTGIVAFYAGAERINRAMGSMIQPMMQAMYPRASRMADKDRRAAASSVRTTIYISFAIASLVGLVLYLFAPLIIRVALGTGYEGAVPVLRILLLLLPIGAISTPLIMHWVFPLELERLVTKITIVGGVIHIPLAIVLGSQYAHIGVAWAAVSTSMFIFVVLLVILTARGLAPIGRSVQQPASQSDPV